MMIRQPLKNIKYFISVYISYLQISTNPICRKLESSKENICWSCLFYIHLSQHLVPIDKDGYSFANKISIMTLVICCNLYFQCVTVPYTRNVMERFWPTVQAVPRTAEKRRWVAFSLHHKSLYIVFHMVHTRGECTSSLSVSIYNRT